MQERLSDVVQTVEQVMAAARIDFELSLKATAIADGLVFKVDGQLVRRMLFRSFEQLVDIGFRQRDWKQTVLETVIEENISERRCDHTAEAVVVQRPHRMLTATTAAKILAGDKDRRTLDVDLIQLEGRIRRRAIVVKSPIEKQKLTEPRAFDSFKELLGNDLVRVDIGAIECRHDAGLNGEVLHR